MGKKIKNYPVFWIIALNLLFFCGTVNYLNESVYNWLSASSIKFTNHWLNDGITADRFAMLEQPISIESPTIQDRKPYISYPNGVVLLCYGIAKLLGYKQIDMSFIKPLSIVIYLLDALMIGLLIYLLLTYIIRLRSRYKTIILSVFLSYLWISLPNNIFFLKNVFFADQLVLFFIYLFLLLEVLRTFVPIAKPSIRFLINSLLFICIFFGMLIEYYFWFQVFVVIVLHFIRSLRRKEKFPDNLKNLLIYIIPAVLAIGVFFLQITRIDHWSDILMAKFTERTGQSDVIAKYYPLRIGHSVYITYKALGLLLFAASGVALIYLSNMGIKKEKMQNKIHNQLLLFSFMVVLPVFIQLLVFMNHSAVHDFSILKLGFPFILGIVLIAYCFSLYKKKATDYFFLITVLAITAYTFYIQGNTYSFYARRLAPDGDRSGLKGFEPIVEELNDYNHVFFSFTDSIPIDPPLSIAITKKMVYKIDTIGDIKAKFPNLNPNAKIMILTNQNAAKSAETLQNEQKALERAKLVKETNPYAVYQLLSFE